MQSYQFIPAASRGGYDCLLGPPHGANSDSFENLQSRITTAAVNPRFLRAERSAYGVYLRPQDADLESAETINERVIICNP